jgi:hypothetical protein
MQKDLTGMEIVQIVLALCAIEGFGLSITISRKGILDIIGYQFDVFPVAAGVVLMVLCPIIAYLLSCRFKREH